MRILVTVSPRIYRESVASSMRRRRPNLEVRAAPPEEAELELAGFGPHLLEPFELVWKYHGAYAFGRTNASRLAPGPLGGCDCIVNHRFSFLLGPPGGPSS